MQPIIITGCQRSGTSLIAGILFHLGVYLGPEFLKRDINCPLGFFEDLEFGNNDERRFNGDITQEQWDDEVNKIVEKRSLQFENAQPLGFTRWGWKNPSTALFLDDYERLKPIIVWCEREKQDNLESLKKLYGDVDWLDKMYEKKQANKRGYVIKLEDFKANPKYEMGKLVGYLGLEPTREQYAKANRHILGKHKHGKPPETESYHYYL